MSLTLISIGKKVPGLDSVRILRVLNDFIFRIELLSHLPPALDHIDRISIELGSELKSLFISYRQIAHIIGSESVLEENELRANQIIQSIIRSFGNNPSAMLSLKKKFNKLQSLSLSDFLEFIRNFRAMLLDLLLTSRKDYILRNQYLRLLQDENDSQFIEISSLNDLVQKYVVQRSIELEKKNFQLKYVKAELDTLQRINHEDVQLLKKESNKQKDQINLSLLNNKQHKFESLSVITNQSKEIYQKHKQIEDSLREKKERIEQEVDNWIIRYDKEMTEKQDRIVYLMEQYEQRMLFHQQFNEKIFVLEHEYLAVIDAKKFQREREEEQDKLLEAHLCAIIKLQYYYRRYLKQHPEKAKLKKGKSKMKGKKFIK